MSRGGTQKYSAFSPRLFGVSDETQDNFDDTGATTSVPAPRPRATGRHSNGEMPDSFPPADAEKDSPSKPVFPPISSIVSSQDSPDQVASAEKPSSVKREDPPDRLAGKTIDSRYVIEKRLARGGMATVYRARDTRLDRPIALKIMYPHLAESADFVARFRREARAAAKLTHPGVVAVYDQGSIEGSSYLVMELVRGPNLRTYLRSQGCLNLGEALKITKEILQALAAAHRSGLVHRDVKPENVLLPENGPVKVADFGLARAASEVTAATTGSILGTVAYLSPETVSGAPADARVDVYATGIILYELLAGVAPFSGDSPIQIAYAHVHEDVPRLKDTLDWVPDSVDDLIARLTQRDPEKRPLNGDAALELIDQVISELSPEELALKGDTKPTVDPVALEREQQLTPTLSEVPLPGTPGSPNGKKQRRWKKNSGKSKDLADKASGSSAASKTVSPQKRTRLRLIGGIVGAVLVVAAILTWFFLWGPGSFRPMTDVVNQQWSDASKNLTAAEVPFERHDVFDDEVPAGNVVRTEPGPGKDLGRFETAKVFVSKGIEMLTMPDLNGKTREEAEALIKETRFDAPHVSEDFHDTVEQGKVFNQDPAPNATVPHNTIVKFTVSKGRQPISMPNVVGMSDSVARDMLTQLGLKVDLTETFSDDVPKGKVINQSIAPNTTAYRLDQVSLTVSKGPEMVKVPNIYGKTESEARSALEGAGLKVKVRRTFGDSKRVLSVDPRTGSSIKVGSTVTITLF